jgi:hypothetical protein
MIAAEATDIFRVHQIRLVDAKKITVLRLDDVLYLVKLLIKAIPVGIRNYMGASALGGKIYNIPKCNMLIVWTYIVCKRIAII